MPAHARKLHELRRKLLAQRDRITDHLLLILVENAPRRSGELHHRAERMHLRRTHKQLGIEGRARQKRRPAAAAYHVRAHERMAEKPAGDHVRHELLEFAPLVALVVQALDHRLPLKAPCVAVFAHGIVQRIARIRKDLIAAGRAFRIGAVAMRIVVHAAAVELEAVRAEVADEPVKLLLEPCAGVRMGEVEQCGIAVPPADGGRLASVHEEAAFCRIALHVVWIRAPGDAAEGRQIHADPRTHPQDHLEAHRMELVHHSLRIAEARRLEPPIAISRLPCVVDHQHARRQTVIEHRLRIREDILLVLMVRKLNPRVVLRCREEQEIRRLSVRREPGLRSVAERIAQGLPRLRHDDLRRIARDGYGSVGDCNRRLVVAPDHAPFI